MWQQNRHNNGDYKDYKVPIYSLKTCMNQSYVQNLLAKNTLKKAIVVKVLTLPGA
jgi:hypothetical protein